MKYDCVIIGGGVSGMTTAVIAARKGYHTALVEVSRKTAPTIRGFERQDLFFDTGFHYTGGLNKGEPLDVFFRYLGLSDKVERFPFDEDGFDSFRCLQPLFEFRFPYGYDRIREKLWHSFPKDGKAVDAYLKAVHHAYHSQPYINLDMDLESQGLGTIHGPSLKEFLNTITDNEILKSILSMHCLLHGVTPGEVSFLSHAFVAGSYYESANGIKGGGLRLAEAFDARLKELGVDVFCGMEAKEILVSGDRAVSGVRVGDDTVLECGCCVATIHPGQLLGLVPASMFRPVYRKRLEQLEDTCSAVMVYLKSALPIESLEKTNLFLFPTTGLSDPQRNGSVEDGPLFVARARQDYRNTLQEGCVVICPVPHLGSESSSIPFPLDDSKAYRAYKQGMSEGITAHLQSSCPEFQGILSQVECSTPLTLKNYTHSPVGSLYGVKHRTEQYNPMSTTRIKNLFLAGQAITAPGVLGAVVSGFLACGNIFGHGKLREEIREWA